MSFDAPMEADWHRMISEAAYFRAEQRGFAPGCAIDDWLLAEQEIHEHLQSAGIATLRRYENDGVSGPAEPI